MSKKLAIRSSTAEFLTFTAQNGEDSVEVRYKDGTVWLTQKMMAALFQVGKAAISKHLSNIYESGELDKKATVSILETVQKEATRSIQRDIEYYNLDAVISVGYRVNSKRATQFRRWATQVLRQFAIRGYVLDRQRLENGVFLGENYFEQLLEEIREIRLSERNFYQKITDLYTTSLDYDKDAPATHGFFAIVQNKLHYAIHGRTAAELIQQRADSEQPNMGLTSWASAPSGRILKSDVSIAKNYLAKEELQSLGRVVNAFLELAEDRAQRKIPMTMEDWATHLDRFLELGERQILERSGKISASDAREHAVSEFEKYRVIQDKLYKSDFDKVTKAIKQQLKEEDDE